MGFTACDCGSSFHLVYRTDRTGAWRWYHCKRCGSRYSALIRPERRPSVCIFEPKNLSREDMTWVKVVDGALMVCERHSA